MYLATRTFEEAFPEIEDIRVELKETGYKISPPYDRPFVYTKDDLILKKSCSRPNCSGKGSGYNLQSIITTMVIKKETTHQELVCCNGYVGSRKAGRDCLNYIDLNITIKYEEAAS